MLEAAPQDSTEFGLELPPQLIKNFWFRAAMLAAVALVILLPRAKGLGTYGTADEPNYLKYSASFYYLLHEGRYSETDLIVHPGVTDLWSGALAFWLYLPDYVDDPEAAYPLPDMTFKQIVERAGMNKETMLALSRRFVVGFQTVLLVTAFYFGWQAFGLPRTLLAVLLVSFDPFYFANSRILQPDGFLSAAMLLGLTALLAYVRRRSKWALLVSAAAAGLGILSKVPGVFLLPVAGLVLAANWWWGQGSDRRQPKGLVRLLGVYLLWLAVVGLTVFALWPSMWVQPGASLQRLMDFTHSASTEVNSPMFFNGQIVPEGEFGPAYWYYYPLSFLWRTTPVILLGLAAGLAAWRLGRGKGQKDAHQRFALLVFLISALLMAVFFTLSAKKFDRYILPAVVCLDVVAAFGWVGFLEAYLRRWRGRAFRWTAVALLAVMAGWQAALVWQAAPYYHSYFNPWLGGLEKAPQVMMVGWGEGLNEAGNYLNHQNSERYPVVYSFYSSTLDLHFEGSSNALPISAPVSDALFADILQADYVVIYINQRQRNSAERVLDYLAEKPAEYVVEIQGVPYVWVYNMAEIAGRAPVDSN